MPKIRDLGIKVVPETMRPAECAQFTACVCTAITNPCFGCTANFTIHHCAWYTTITLQCANPTFHCAFGSGGCGFSPVCGGSIDPTIQVQQGELSREQIATLREQLQQQISALEEYAKSVGPKTAEEIDAREKQLNEELTQLKTRRKELGGSK